ncbi:hypothetical protein VitviT2T_020797 [Vitis vinifera]|uniref:WAT1-related protein n=2 Tax=Vitis vinifera TaxID=29760 RepID=A0ABY9D4Z6_VITVI|nr:WAT1-related protein At1g09380 isoform X1 [Vitis vinifera]WKA02635.1 hypothetical protein VitviT2T_020797 [Vitis vinifera]|eukprot:XP_002277072.1 PREDICTED: WAT1-related protein At1g09380 isoform X1 [Vitis vinifera]
MGGDYLPFLAMFLVQMGYAGMNIFVKLAMDSGMNPFILVAYRQIFATVAMIPFAYFLERKTRPKITRIVLFQAFLSSIFGATLNQILYFIGLKHSNPTLGCAFNNLFPAMTFLLAVPFRLETVGIKTRPGQAKVLGTVVCIGGAMILTFYRGHAINIGESGIHWKYAEQLKTRDSQSGANFILGPFLLITSCISWAIWFIIQGRMCVKFAAPYTSSTLMCFMASIECGVIGLFVDHQPSAWSLNDSIRLIAALYSAIVCTALAFCLMSWTIQRKGPLYVSVFSPLLLVIVAILSWALLRDKLHFGTVVGSLFVVLGLYAVLWGKGKEENQRGSREEAEEGKEDLELQINGKLYIRS